MACLLHNILGKNKMGGQTMSKRRILIIEDDYYKCFTWKQILKIQFNLPVEYIESGYGESLHILSEKYQPHSVYYTPYQTAFDFITKLKQRKVNCLNSHVVLVARTEDEAS